MWAVCPRGWRPSILRAIPLLMILSMSPGCAYLAVGLALVGSGGGGGGGKKGNPAPSVVFTATPMPQAADLFAQIDYDLVDRGGQDVDIFVELSTDFGATWAPATEAPGSDGTVGLAASAPGVPHVYLWNFFNDLFANDIGSLSTLSFPASLRFTPTDSKGKSGPSDLIAFRVGNLEPLVAIDPVVVGPADPSVRIDYTLFDDFGDDLDLVVEYSLDGFVTPGQPATPVGGSICDGITAVSSDPLGAAHCFEWDYQVDFPAAVDGAVIRMTATDPAGAVSATVETEPLRLGNDAPVATILNIDTSFGVSIDFLLQDTTSDLASVGVDFSTDGGSSYAAATSLIGGVSGLATAPGGVAHNVTWIAVGDLGAGSFPSLRVRLRPQDPFAMGGAAESAIFSATITDLPLAFVTAPVAGSLAAAATQVIYVLADANSNDVDLVIEYRGGGSPLFGPATEVPGLPSEGVSGLTSSPAGIGHVFVWDTLSDLGNVDLTDVELRITPSDPGGTGPASVVGPFKLNNNVAPQVQAILDPAIPATGDIPILYTLADPESDPADILVEFSTDGGLTWPSHCHEPPFGAGSDGIDQLSTNPFGEFHVFAWDSARDIGAVRQPNVVVRITPRDNADDSLGLGMRAQSGPFTVDNDPATAPPRVGTLSPSFGPAAGGNPIIIFGSGFIQGSVATLGGQPISNQSIVSFTTITGQAPAWQGGMQTVDLVVTTPNGSYTLPESYNYDVPPPGIVSVTPSSGDVAGGTPVTIVTEFFSDDWAVAPPSIVDFGQGPATNVVGTAANTFTCMTPPGQQPGQVDVSVQGASGDSVLLPRGFTYTAGTGCSIGSITPASGGLAGGEMVTIDGSGFVPVGPLPTVAFGGALATVDPSTTDMQINCFAPPGISVGTVTVTVTNSASDICQTSYDYDVTGVLDTEFGTRGFFTHIGAAGGTGQDEARDVVVDGSGNLLVAGLSITMDFDEDAAVWKLDPQGRLDPTFGSGGFVVEGMAGGVQFGDQAIWSLALDGQGRIVAVGSATGVSADDLAVWRFTAAGALDTAFNGVGYLTQDGAAGGAGNDEARDLVVDPVTDAITMAGKSTNAAGNTDVTVWRVLSDGTFDATFGGTGWVVHDGAAGGVTEAGFGIAEDASGNLVVAGPGTNASTRNDFVVWRFTPAGALDTTFNGVGFNTLDIGGPTESDLPRAVDIDSTGRILVGGYASLGVNRDPAVAAFNSDGTLDTTFGGGMGYVRQDTSGADDQGMDLRVDAQDRIVLTGFVADVDAGIWRWNPDGSFDTSFAGQGWTLLDFGGTFEQGFGVTIRSGGEILVAGTHAGEAALWQLRSDGVLDPGLVPGTGFVTHNGAGGGNLDDAAEEVAVHPDGRIFAAGWSFDGSFVDEAVTWSYLPDGTLDGSFFGGFDVQTNIAGGGLYDTPRGVTVDGTGRILVSGESSGPGNDDAFVIAYDAGGFLDSSFGTGGIVVLDNIAGGGGTDHGMNLVTDASDRIVLVGHSTGVNLEDMFALRLDATGALDPTFGTGGIFSHDDAAGGLDSDEALAVTLDGAGRVVVTGRSWNAAFNEDMVIWVLTPGGALDTGFNGVGWVVDSDPAAVGTDQGLDVVTDASDRILVAGSTTSVSDAAAVWRYNPDGTPDATFAGGAGVFIHDGAAGGSGSDVAWGIEIDATGRLIVAGESVNAGFNYDMVVWRLDSGGVLDPSFGGGTGGFLVHDDAAGGAGDDRGLGLSIDADGRIVVAGESLGASGNFDMTIWRIE